MQKTVTVYSIAKYLEKRDRFINATLIRKNGQSFILEDGKEIPVKKWEENNPYPVYKKFNDKGITLDKRFDFLN